MHVTVIAKAPVPGRVKTRLCPPCTPEQAAEVAATALAETLEGVEAVAAATGARRVLLLDGDVQPWMPATFDVVAQRGDGLGERLGNGFADLGPGLIIGMETPHATTTLVEGLRWVRRGHEVLGPALDGGYWMIGLSASGVALGGRVFDGVRMSRPDTGVAQLDRLHALGRPVRLLPTERDLDTYDDLVAIASSGRSGRLADLARVIVRGQLAS